MATMLRCVFPVWTVEQNATNMRKDGIKIFNDWSRKAEQADCVHIATRYLACRMQLYDDTISTR